MISATRIMLRCIYLLLILKLNSIYGFDAGFIQLAQSRQSNQDTTHYGMTVCALCRVTLNVLKSTYDIDTAYLDSKFDGTTGQCDDNIVRIIMKLLQSSQMKGINPWLYSNTIKSIASANTKTDLKEMFKEESHFDSESFIGGSKLILKRYQSALDAIKSFDNYDHARKTFGEMLHTIQDFYSHTNYIELEFQTPNDVLGKRIFQQEEFATGEERTCVSCTDQQCRDTSNVAQNIRQNKILTSGYFIPLGFNFLRKFKPRGKCSHGGAFDSTQDDEPTGGINKDKRDSIHGHLHYQAARMAYNATVKILTQLQEDIGDDSFSLFLTLKKNSNSLVISIDMSCSIGNYVDLAKQVSINIVNQYGQLDYAPHNYILITFNNQLTRMVINTRTPSNLISAIEALTCENYDSALGGMYYTSIVEGLILSEYGSVIYTFTDSVANDGYLKYKARALLRNKRNVIYSFLGQKMQKLLLRSKIDVVDQLNSTDDSTDLPSISGGLTYPITVNDQSVISEFILRRLEWTQLQSLSIFKSNATSVKFYVDSSIRELLIDISSTGIITGIDQFELLTPSSSAYSLNTNLNHTQYLYMWKILQPDVGGWRLRISSSSQVFNLNVQIQGKSSIVCSSALQKNMEGNVDSTGYTELTTEPLVNSYLLILTTCENANFTTANISLIDQSGQIIVTYSPLKIDQGDIVTNISVPSKPFRIQTMLQLLNGVQVQRIEKQLISPSMFSINLINQPYIVSPGQTIQMNYTLKSLSPEKVNIRLQIRDVLGLVNSNNTEENFNFTNETAQMRSFTLPSDYAQNSINDIIIFTLLTYNSTTGKLAYQNDDIGLAYFDHAPSIPRATKFFIFSLLSLLVFYDIIF